MTTTPERLIRAAHLLTLFAFGVAQPLYDQLGQHPVFFTAHGVGFGAVLGLALTLSLFIPGGLALIGLTLARLSEAWANRFHLAWVGILGVLIALPILRMLMGDWTVIILLVSVLLGMGGTILYARSKTARSFLTIVSPAILVFPVLFLTVVPAAKLARSAPEGALAGVDVREPVPIILLIFDEQGLSVLLDDENDIDGIRFPGFARLRQLSTWYPNATSVTSSTEAAVPAILTGTLVHDPADLPTASQHPENLFTWLGGVLEPNVSETITALCPPSVCTAESGLGRSAAGEMLLNDIVVVYLHLILPEKLANDLLPPITASWSGFTFDEEEVTAPARHRANHDPPIPGIGDGRDFHRNGVGHRFARFDDFLRRINPDAPGSLNFLHIKLPHLPYEYLPSGRIYLKERSTFPAGLTSDTQPWSDDEVLVKASNRRYLAQVAFVDHLLNRLLDDLEGAGILERSLLIVMSDHGVCNRPGQFRRRATPANVGDVLTIPLFIKYPAQSDGRVDMRAASSIDIIPTIAEVVKTSVPWRTAGHSLLPETFPRRDEVPRLADFRLYDHAGERWLAARSIRRKELSVRATRDWYRRIFGIGTPWERSVPASRHSSLIGKRLRSLNTGAASGWRVSEFQGRHELDRVSLSSGFLPALVRARIDTAEPIDIAIALNREIAACTTATTHRGSPGFVTALLPESLFREGRNELAFYWVEEGGEGPVLRPIALPLPEVKKKDPLTDTAAYFDGQRVISRSLEVSVSSLFRLEMILKSDVEPGQMYDIGESTPPMPTIVGPLAIYENLAGYTLSVKNAAGEPTYVEVEGSPTQWQTFVIERTALGIRIYHNDTLVRTLPGEFELRPGLTLGRGHKQRFWRGWIRQFEISSIAETGEEQIVFSHP